MRYRCAAFDIDGTLLDSAPADAAGLHRALAQELGRDVPMDVIFGTFGLPGRDILRALEIPEADAERVMRVWQAEKRARAGWMRLFPGVEGALRALRARGVRLGVVTSKRPKTYALDFVPFGLDDCFDIRITCADTERSRNFPCHLFRRSCSGTIKNTCLFHCFVCLSNTICKETSCTRTCKYRIVGIFHRRHRKNPLNQGSG